MKKAKSISRRVTRPVSREAIRSFLKVPVARRLEWIEEMIRFQAGLPPKTRKALERYRELARRPLSD